MLTIRKSQMKVFQREAERNFLDAVLEQLRSSHAAVIKDVEDDILRKRVAYGIARAREYGLTWKTNLTTFVMLMFDLGPEFDRHPAFFRCLNNVKVEPDKRMGVLIKEMTEDDWQIARQRQIAAQWPEGCR